MVTGHIAEILDTPEIVKSVESGDAGDTEGGPQATRGRGEEGEAPWSGVTVNRCRGAGVTFQILRNGNLQIGLQS